MAHPTDQQWQLYRRYLARDRRAVREAYQLLSKRYGAFLALMLIDFIRKSEAVPTESTFADPLYHARPEVFAEAWDERRDLRGRPIGDQVDVVSDVVQDLWGQFVQTLSRDRFERDLARGDFVLTKTAADSYVEITRDELESWLDTLPLKGKWQLKTGRVSVYLLPLSSTVAVSLSSTVAFGEKAMGRGKASMNLALVSLVTGRTINRKAMGQAYFKRTTNWRVTWRKGFDRMEAAYKKSQGFYDALAAIEDRDKYKADILSRIEAFPGWEADNVLSDFYARVQRGGILTSRQLGLLDRTLAQDAADSPVTPAVAPPTVDDQLLQRVRELWKAARRSGDDWLMDFAKSIGQRLKDGRDLSPKQQAALDRNLSRYRVGSTELRQVLRSLHRRRRP